MYLICHVTLRDPLIVRSCKSMGGRSSKYDKNMIGLVNIGIMIVKICHETSLEHM